MFQNKTVNLIISVILAIALWAYVVGQVNPETTKKFQNIKVSFVNEDSLEENGLALLDPGTVTVDVTVQGKRSVIKKTDTSDIQVKADLYGREKGSNTINLEVKLPSGLQMTRISQEDVTVTIENRITEEKSVKVHFSGNAKDSMEAGDAKADPDKIQVSGAQSAVESVSYIMADVDVSKIKGDNDTITADAIPVTEKGKTVGHLDISSDKVKVTASMLNTKKVPLKVDVTGEVDDSCQLSSVNVPDKITIRGTEKNLKDITSVTAKDISLDGITKNSVIPVVPVLPDGIEVAKASKDLSVEVIVKTLASATFDYKSGDIDINGLSDDLKAKVRSDAVKLTAVGKDSVVSSLSSGDFSLSADLSDLSEGTHKVSIKASYTKTLSRVSLSPDQIQVTITKK